MEFSYELHDIERIAREIISNARSKTLLFHGTMGVGKTTLIKAIVNVLGSDDEVSSPTFSIVNEYKSNDDVIYHFDLYRIKNIEEAYNFGIEDYLNSDSWVLIEWPEKIEDILFDDYDKIILELGINNNRILNLDNTKNNQ